jgi:hypothetical protein
MARPTIIRRWNNHDKVLAWGENDNPSLADLVNAAQREFPGVALSQVTVNNFVLVTKGPMYQKTKPELRVVR